MLLSQSQGGGASGGQSGHSSGLQQPPAPGSSAGVDDSSDEDEKVDVGGAADLQTSMSCGKDGKWASRFSSNFIFRFTTVYIVILKLFSN